ncbi:MAG TPA: hypothetical protein DD435_06180 [Cyanobacteria bacterium UBA8530]|nr:hypothetical protein [Cyanobacteria bacterium UBA8530]
MKPFFKLICGASLLDPVEIEFLSRVYSEAGAGIIDLAAHPEAVAAAFRGKGKTARNPLLMVSVAVEDDPHLLIAKKNLDKCSRCGLCEETCFERCCGCGKCARLCPEGAIEMLRKEWGVDLDSCWEAGARGLELHTGSGKKEAVDSWRKVCEDWVKRGGHFSCSVNGRQLDSEEAIRVAREVRSWFELPILIQTDGNPISGQKGEDSTLPALSLAREILSSGIDAHIQPAGGANDQTARLAEQMKLPIAGVGMGSFARNLVRGKSFESAVLEASRLVASVF